MTRATGPAAAPAHFLASGCGPCQKISALAPRHPSPCSFFSLYNKCIQAFIKANEEQVKGGLGGTLATRAAMVSAAFWRTSEASQRVRFFSVGKIGRSWRGYLSLAPRSLGMVI